MFGQSRRQVHPLRPGSRHTHPKDEPHSPLGKPVHAYGTMMSFEELSPAKHPNATHRRAAGVARLGWLD